MEATDHDKSNRSCDCRTGFYFSGMVMEYHSRGVSLPWRVGQRLHEMREV